MPFEKKYSGETRAAAIARVIERRTQEPTNRSVIREVAEEFEIGEQSLRQWVSRLDDGVFSYRSRPAATTSEPTAQQRIAELEEQVRTLTEENEVLKRASSIFAAELTKRWG